MIRLEKIVKSYQMGENTLTVLHGIDLTIEKGELTAIIGPSGSGKSTTMNIIGLLDKPTSGRYFLHDRDVADIDADEQSTMRNQYIGFIFQSFLLLPRLTAVENVGMPLKYRGVPRQEIYERSMAALERINVQHLADHRPSEMSGGQQQRIAIARSLVGEPSLIMADEPTGALDSKTSQEVMNILIELNQQQGTTVVIVTHDMGVAEQCRRVVKVKDGRIIQS